MSHSRDTFRHAAIYSAASLLGKMIAFLMLPLYAHTLGTGGYGVIGMVDASIALLTSVLAYGSQNAITRIYHEQEASRQSLAISTGYWVTLLASLSLTACAMLTSPWLSALLFGERELFLLLCLALLAFFLDMNTQAATTVLTIRRQSLLFSSLSLLRLLVGLSLNIVFIVVLDWGLFGYFLSSVLTSLLHFTVAQRICLRQCGSGFDRALAASIVQFQLPLIPGALVSFAARQTERIALRFFESIEKVGVLEMGYKFPSLITLLIHEPFMNAWNTERIRLAQAGSGEAAKKIGDMFTLAFFPLVLLSLMIALCMRDVLVLLTPPSFWQAERIAQIECLTLVLGCATQHVSLGFLHRKDTREWALLTSGISVAKIGMSFGFVAALGILGAAYSALCAAVVLFVLALRGGQRRYRVHYRGPLNAAIVALALLLFALAEHGDQVLLQSAQACSAALLDGVPDPTVWAGAELPALLREKLPYAIDALLRCLLGLLLLLLLPLIYPHTRQRLAGAFGNL